MWPTIIQCSCTVLTLIITLCTLYNKMIKSQVTKADLDVVNKNITTMTGKIDDLREQYTELSERVAVVEYAIRTHHPVGGVPAIPHHHTPTDHHT